MTSFKAMCMKVYCQFNVWFCVSCVVVLHENKDDLTALHCKVVCLVQNGSFKEALNVMNTHSKVLGR